MKTKTTHFATLLMALLLLVSCKTAQEILETGDYDRAISESIKKIRGKKKKKEDFVLVIEHAFHLANDRDLDRIAALKASGDDSAWEEIHALYTRIDERQHRIKPLLPLRAKTGYVAFFDMLDVQTHLGESRKNAAAYLYASAQDMLEDAEAGDKLAARRAYDRLVRIDYLYEEYLDTDRQMDRALRLGQNHVYLEMVNNSTAILDRDFEDVLLDISLSGLDSRWVRYHTIRPEVAIDYSAIIKIRSLDVSPEQYKENRFTETREVRDGNRYVLDANGNVAKDTLGNDITEPNYIEVRADVREVCQYKEAIIEGSLDFYDHSSNELISSQRIQSNAIFEHWTSSYSGDQRALSSDARRYMSQPIVSFPTDESLVYDAAEALKPEIKRHLRVMSADAP